MSEVSRPVDPEELLSHVVRLRALAHRLVSDDGRADDIVQAAALASLERPPGAGVPFGPWISGVVRNLSRRTWRSETRRARYEAAAPPPAPEEPPDYVAARAEAYEVLVAAVNALDPIYREVIVLHYFDGLTVSDVAERLRVPVETARTRVRRALSILRERLVPRDRDRRALALVLLGGVPRSPPAYAAPAVAAAGGLLMTKQLAGAAVVCALIVTAVVAGNRPGVAPRQTSDALPADERPVIMARVRAAAPAPVEVAAVPPADSDERLIDVLDALTDAPIAGALVLLRVGDDEVALTSDTDGRASSELPEETDVDSVVVAAQGYVGGEAVRSRGGRYHAALDPIRMGREQGALIGTVVGGDGDPVGGVLVRARLPGTGLFIAVSDESGRFHLDLPTFSSFLVMLSATDDQHGTGFACVRGGDTDTLGWTTTTDARLVLGEGQALRVDVITASGAASHALTATPLWEWGTLAASHTWTVSTGDTINVPIGAWRMELADESGVRVALPQVAVVSADGVRIAAAGDAWARELRGAPVDSITFEASSQKARFRVMGPDGAPLAGVRVLVEDAALAEAAGPSFEETSDEIYRRSFITAWVGQPRRAPPARRIEAVTDADGRADVQGWIPLPAVVSVHGPFVVTSYRALERDEVERGDVELTARLGARVLVTFPPFLRGCLLEETTTKQLVQFKADRANQAVPAGTWRARLSRLPQRTTDEDVLVPPFSLALGETRALDLSALEPKVTDVVYLRRLSELDDTWYRSVFGADTALRRLAGGTGSFEVARVNCDGFRRYELIWTESGAQHTHAVDVRGGADVRSPVVLEHELDYESGRARLTIDGLVPGTALSVCSGDPEPDAPDIDFHHVRIPYEAASAGDVGIDLPPGRYSVNVVGPTRRTCAETRFQVTAGATENVVVHVQDLGLVIDLDGVEETPKTRPFGHVLLHPAGSDDRKDAILSSRWTGPRALFRRVPPGRYRVCVMRLGPMRQEDGVGRASYEVANEGTIEVGDDRSEPVTVDMR